jgi:hypothetical protein
MKVSARPLRPTTASNEVFGVATSGGIAVLVVMVAGIVGVAGCGPQQTLDRTSVPPPRTDRTGGDAGWSQDARSIWDAAPEMAGLDRAPIDAAIDLTPGELDARPASDSVSPVEVLDVTPPEGAVAVDPAPAPTMNGPRSMAPGTLVVRSAPASAETDLSRVGELDWVHWGHQGPSAITRKRAVVARIEGAVVGRGEVVTYEDRPPRVSWTDGTPTATARTRQGIAIGGAVGLGFVVRVAGPLAGISRLSVQLGAWNARGTLEVLVEGQPGPRHQDGNLDAVHPGSDYSTIVDFGPLGTGHALTLKWTVGVLHHRFGNVTILAAGLSSRRRLESAPRFSR